MPQDAPSESSEMIDCRVLGRKVWDLNWFIFASFVSWSRMMSAGLFRNVFWVAQTPDIPAEESVIDRVTH